MPAQIDRFTLPEAMKTEDCQTLDAFLRGSFAKNIELEGGNVRKLNSMAAQLILAHQKIGNAQGSAIIVTNPSEALIADLEALELSQILAPAGASE